ncbi:hypothetical protein A2U01_0091907 [Trifolium medium]|uniref:Uncharacterized protein n=1 Tax=Trifolium medium TaxID=97028 RepID=A0A392UD63_9FABA|nr:hypothetical protein [Trifolium medium]
MWPVRVLGSDLLRSTVFPFIVFSFTIVIYSDCILQ